MGAKKVFFLSDMHLGARYLPDKQLAERRVVAFLRSIKHEAEAVYLLGDVLDYWYDYRHVVPRGYVRFFGALAELVDAGVRVVWMTGNHDIWLFGYFEQEIGVEVAREPRVEVIRGKKFYLSHGDAEASESRSFRFMRWLFHNPLCQKLFAAVHPRWTVPLGYCLSSNSRDFEEYATVPFEGIDKSGQAQFALRYLREVDPAIQCFIFGHTHVVADEQLTPGCQLIILGDWITQFSYAVYDGDRVEVKVFDC